MKTAHWVSGKIYLSGLLAALALSGLTGTSLAQAADGPKCTTKNTITADVVAIEQTYFYNRFGSFNPHRMIFALRDDVVDSENGQSLSAGLRPGKVRLRSDKRPRPLVLRVNEEDCLQVKF